jgi:hypothetical protein
MNNQCDNAIMLKQVYIPIGKRLTFVWEFYKEGAFGQYQILLFKNYQVKVSGDTKK